MSGVLLVERSVGNKGGMDFFLLKEIHGSYRFDNLLFKDFSRTFPGLFNNMQGVRFHRHTITYFPQSLQKSNTCKCK